MRQKLTAILPVVMVVLLAALAVFADDLVVDGKLESTATLGAPLVVASSAVVTNLNADMLDGSHAADFADAGATTAAIADLQSQITNLSTVTETGQVVCSNEDGDTILCPNTGQDGELKSGLAWPLPRFSENGDGTVTDNLTKLVWLQNPFCGSTMEWEAALVFANTLFDGSAWSKSCGSAPEWE